MSHPRVPLPLIMKGCAEGDVVRKSLRRSVNVSPKVLTKAGETWLSLLFVSNQLEVQLSPRKRVTRTHGRT